MVNKQAHNVKQPRHPADYKNNMYSFYVFVHAPQPPKGGANLLIFYMTSPSHSPFRGLGGILFYHLNRVFHVIKRDIGHNAVAQVKDETLLIFHPIEQAVYAVFNYFFIGIQNMRVKVTLHCNACGQTLFNIKQINVPVDADHIRLSLGHEWREYRTAFTEGYHRDILTVKLADD